MLLLHLSLATVNSLFGQGVLASFNSVVLVVPDIRFKFNNVLHCVALCYIVMSVFSLRTCCFQVKLREHV